MDIHKAYNSDVGSDLYKNRGEITMVCFANRNTYRITANKSGIVLTLCALRPSRGGVGRVKTHQLTTWGGTDNYWSRHNDPC